MTTPRRILLADADAFFVAVARMVDPEGAGRAPLLIVGGKPGSRGVVCSASYETRAFGVRSAMPIAQALRLCPDALCVPVPRGACTATSRAIGAVLHRFTPVVQAASIDEWYLDLSGTEALYAPESFEQTARRIRETVHRETGIHLSFGGGTSKLVAKLAAERAKPRADVGGDGVRLIEPGLEGAFLREFTLGDLPGVGPKLKAKLATLGLERVDDVLPHDRATLARWLGRRPAEWLWARVRGIHDAPVEGRAPAKQVSRETTFREDLADTAAIARQLRSLVGIVASELRRDRTSARTVTVKLKDRDFTTRLASQTVPEPLESDRAIGELALALLTRLRSARRVPARLVGVAVSGLAPARDAEQLALFGGVPAVERPEDRAVSRAVDRVRERFGSAAITVGVDGSPAPRSR
ncbi:MAG: DNA polymerase IV [Gemmatimonadota bacterium]|nr:DNA polymerase IV [Gemmatimonadota bacterium]MDQ8147563.1 DNA polymerase IV [Gemmatimonadota bacterium]MDQ8149701.1 DNA polymerase IV [Gemmatimonadota bacterium]MDQ8177026.1 DNA polymerase IV [Gemmatimonadota bacterium]